MSSYYFYWNVFTNTSYWGSDSQIESQFIRKIAAKELGKSFWDWKNGHKISNIEIDIYTKKIRDILSKR